MKDQDIIALYFARAESAIEETAKKYGKYCRYIAEHILENEFDAEEVVNDTYLKTWNSIPPNRPDPLKPYVGMITRQLAFDAYDARHAQKHNGQVALILNELADCIPNGDDGTDLGENLALKEALDKFVHSLPKKTARIFLRRYWYANTLSEIAKEFGMKENAVAVLMLRTREKLKAFLKEEGF